MRLRTTRGCPAPWATPVARRAGGGGGAGQTNRYDARYDGRGAQGGPDESSMADADGAATATGGRQAAVMHTQKQAPVGLQGVRSLCLQAAKCLYKQGAKCLYLQQERADPSSGVALEAPSSSSVSVGAPELPSRQLLEWSAP